MKIYQDVTKVWGNRKECAESRASKKKAVTTLRPKGGRMEQLFGPRRKDLKVKRGQLPLRGI